MTSIRWGISVKALPGQLVSGDAALVRPDEDEFLFAIIDGLGHGPLAHAAAGAAKQYLLDTKAGSSLPDVLAGLHKKLKSTRGAAIGVLIVTPSTGHAEYAGVGNTVFRQFGKTERRFVSKDGTLGHVMHQPFVQRFVVAQSDFIVMHTDGVRSTVDAKAYSDIMRMDPSSAARHVLQQFGKPSDDASCIVIKSACD